MMTDWTDEQVAYAVRMLLRDQIDHEAICVLARDRIRDLAAERDRLRGELETEKHEAYQHANMRELAEQALYAATARAEAAETQSSIDRKLTETLEARALADAVRITELEAALAEERRLRQDTDSKLMGHDDRLNAAAYELSALLAKYEEERAHAMLVVEVPVDAMDEFQSVCKGYGWKVRK